MFESRITGRRPKRSESAPSTGAKKNWIPANTVPNTPCHHAALVALPPVKSSTSLGSTGITIPNASMSSVTVTRMNTRVGDRTGFNDSPLLVFVPVVQVRPVRVAVHDRLVPVAVGVPERARLARVRVIVVPVVVAVRVLVLERPVRVGVRVPIEREQRDPGAEQ